MTAKSKLLNTFRTFREKETLFLAAKFASGLEGGEIVLLRGPIGAGKTVFVKGLAKALGCDRSPISSSFNIMRSYSGRLRLYHFDLFRLEEAELGEIALGDYLGDDSVTVVEWPDCSEKFYSRFERFVIDIGLENGDERTIKIESKKAFKR